MADLKPRLPRDLLEGQHVILSSGSKASPPKRVDLKPFHETLRILREYDGPPAALPAEQALQPRLHPRASYLKAYFAYLDAEIDGHDTYWCGGMCGTPASGHKAGFYCRLCNAQITHAKGASSDTFKGKQVIGHFANQECTALQGEDLELFLRAILKVDGTFDEPSATAFAERQQDIADRPPQPAARTAAIRVKKEETPSDDDEQHRDSPIKEAVAQSQLHSQSQPQSQSQSQSSQLPAGLQRLPTPDELLAETLALLRRLQKDNADPANRLLFGVGFRKEQLSQASASSNDDENGQGQEPMQQQELIQMFVDQVQQGREAYAGRETMQNYEKLVAKSKAYPDARKAKEAEGTTQAKGKGKGKGNERETDSAGGAE